MDDKLIAEILKDVFGEEGQMFRFDEEKIDLMTFTWQKAIEVVRDMPHNSTRRNIIDKLREKA